MLDTQIPIMISLFDTTTENNNVIDICHIRLRWTDPDFWHDNFNEQNRKYHVVCIAFGVVTKNPKVKIHKKNKFINIYISGMFTGFDENFQLADTVKFVSCAIKAVNSHRLSSKWTKSKPIKIAR
uniref:Uncharacterized protein n=1 Tax=Rhabditophanes sp. KR3021 TaxID=114890 RepID=A0AC35UG87_9BILA